MDGWMIDWWGVTFFLYAACVDIDAWRGVWRLHRGMGKWNLV